ncbi:MAG: D-alanyl-D-alanine carboxypeptidase [Coriobacteriia bacterium]|nr:D-alanyl-D-alanine carboxypeptidase [Coriobacteriia bacterium]
MKTSGFVKIRKAHTVLCNRFITRLNALLIVAVLAFSLVPAQAMAVVGKYDKLQDGVYTDYNISSSLMPDVSMDEGILVTEDGSVLWSRNANERHHIASITKVMTAIVAMDHSKPTDKVTIPKLSTQIGESTASLKSGETMTMEDLLGAALVKSGNDAAVAIAYNVAGSQDKFVTMMNEKAKELGMTGTHFQNPDGLENPQHYSTARDVSIMSRYAMQSPEFRSIVKMKLVRFQTAMAKHTLPSTNLLLWKYQGAIGIKTGWTVPAGYCLSAAALRNGIELYAVTLGTSIDTARFTESATLLDFGFNHYRNQQITVKGTGVGTVEISDYLNKSVAVAMKNGLTIPVFDIAGEITRKLERSPVSAPVQKGDTVGVAKYIQRGKLIATVPLVATEKVSKPFILLRPFIALIKLFN